MIERNKQTAHDFLAHAFGNRQDQAMALLHADATWWVLGDPQRLRVSGLRRVPQIQRLLDGVGRSMPAGMSFVVQGITAESERVAIEIEAQGQLADGRVYQNRYHFLIEMRDDKVASVREYMDTLGVHDLSQTSQP